MAHRSAIVAVTAVVAVGLGALTPDAAAKTKKRPRNFIVSVDTPLGLQGGAGAGANVVIPFTVAARAGRRAEVQVEYGVDRNSDGQITDDEFRPATEDRFDPRNSRSDVAPQLYETARLPGTAAACVWKSLADIGPHREGLFEFALTLQGRLIPDPDNPSAYLHATGPNGNEVWAGVKVRVRTVWQRTKRGWRHASPWIYTDAFEVDNAASPSMTIDSATSGAPITVQWSAYDADSEDLNGNGQLDIAGGEDRNGNNQLDCEKMGVAFDWHILAPGEDPSAMTDAQLAAFRWFECTRLAGAGDTDSLQARPGEPIPATGDLAGVCSAPPGVGRRWTFAWDVAHDVGIWPGNTFILRATPFCEHRKRGSTVYSRIVVASIP